MSAARVHDASLVADVIVMQLESPIGAVQAAADLDDVQEAPVILNPAHAQALPDKLLKMVESHDLAADHQDVVARFRDYFRTARTESSAWPVKPSPRRPVGEAAKPLL